MTNFGTLSYNQSRTFLIRIVALAVALNGITMLWSSLIIGIIDRDEVRSTGSANLQLHIIIALTLIYLAHLLARRKRAAWAVVVPTYAFILGTNVMLAIDRHHMSNLFMLRDIILPFAIAACLIVCRDEFRVKSDIRSFAISLRFVVLALVIALAYGTIGFLLLEKRDFHQDISVFEALHRTIDQFNLTTNHSLITYTRRSRVFMDSLTTVSIAALAYSVVAFFQPLKARYGPQRSRRELVESFLDKFPANSEDYFKLWPADKSYIFDDYQHAAIAYRTERGVALACGGPVGDPDNYQGVVMAFEDECFTNDWLPAFIHVTDTLRDMYERNDYALQQIGEEAVVDLGQFQSSVRGNKYFRNISNRFRKQAYTFNILTAPHNTAVIDRLHDVSREWLQRPGRAERGFILGYFDETYLQQCDIAIARDAAGTIQAFMNLVPYIDKDEANYDMLRHTQHAPSNINDFLLLELFERLAAQGIKRFNLGLCPLAGLGEKDRDRTLIDNALKFIYANGDRFYSFNGLYRFKSKYEPVWKPRYIAYKGGVRGFARTLTALSRALQVPKRRPR